MADVTKAIEFVLRQEDSTLSGTVTTARGDKGGRTRFGISERWHPELNDIGFFFTMSRAAAMAKAEEVMAEEYAAPLSLASISNQGLATALLSLAVLEGVPQAVRALQQAVQVDIDGVMGPKTLAAVNAASSTDLMNQFGLIQRAYFDRIAISDPTQLKWVNGWKNRLNAVEALA